MEAETAQEAHSLLCWLMDEAVLHPGSPRLPKGRSRTFQAHWSFLLRFFRADEWGCWNQRGLCVLSSSSLAPEVQLDHLYIRSNFKTQFLWFLAVKLKVTEILGSFWSPDLWNVSFWPHSRLTQADAVSIPTDLETCDILCVCDKSRQSPWKRNAKKQNGRLRRPYK